ncbi:MAG TPA: ABC transporter substrate-binding protein [Solirubrobacteraceae bacterium]|jgi:peptide/nickel transport system substrate-binding protein|nr:ABC transporter substrate-binding protein [Solirubrobacteraceae bacterium]
MRKYVCVCVALALAVLIAGCGGSKGQSNETASKGGTGSSKSYPELRWGVLSFAGPVDWTKNVNSNSIAVVESLAVNNLMEFESDGKVKPGLASSVEQPDSTTYIYHLKPLKFSDGKPLTAADVVFSLNRDVHSPEAWTKTYWEDVSSITAQNSSTVVMKLKHPSAVIQDVIAFSGEVSEKAQVEKIGEKELGTPANLPIGTGPWKFDSYQPESSITLSRNPYWKGALQPAEKITIGFFKSEASLALALRSGAIDGTFDYLAPKTFANIPGTKQLVAAGTSADFICANTDRPPFNNVHVRRALAYATDAKGMLGALYPAGTAFEDPTVMPASLFTNLGSKSEVEKVLNALPKYEFSLVKARQELAKSPYPHGFSTTLLTEQVAAGQVSSAEIYAADLAKIGINAKVVELTPSEAPEGLSGKTTITFSETYSVYADPEGLMSTILPPSQINPPGSGLNIANYRNAEVDKLEPESVETLNPPKRLQMIGKLLTIMANEAPYWPLYTHATLGTLSEKYVLPTFSAWTMSWTPWALEAKLAS